MENIAAFLAACRTLGVAEHSLFDTKDLHEKRDLTVVVRCMHMLGATVQTTVTDFKGPFLGEFECAINEFDAVVNREWTHSTTFTARYASLS